MTGTPVPLTARTGGAPAVAGQVFEFQLRRDGRDLGAVHTGTAPVWEWTPQEPGEYRSRTVVRDPAGKVLVESDWSAPFEIAPQLKVEQPAADRPAPQAAGTAIRWTTAASGGAGKTSYGFELRPEGAAAATAQSGPESGWLWRPAQAGRYQVRVVAVDANGNRAESEWSVPYEVVPPLMVTTPAADRPTPQTAGTAIRWTAQASGGVGEITYAFELRAGEEESRTVQSGPSPEWSWSPAEAGRYLVWVVAADAHGNQAASQWSVPYEIVPQLAVKAPTPDLPAPQTAGTAVRWQAEASGGVGSRTWSFFVQRGVEETALLQEGVEPLWNWTPNEAGSYRILAGVRDALGNTADSGWSDPYLIDPLPEVTSLPGPGIERQKLIAVLPIENLSGAGGAPLKELRQALIKELKEAGFTLLGDDRLEQFMVSHRIRYVGGMDTATARAFLKETGTTAVLVTSLALYLDGDPPKIALFSRLVSTGDRPEILWMDGVGKAGGESPGLLDLGMIHDPKLLRDKALGFLVSSLANRLEGKRAPDAFFKRTRTFRPKITFNAPYLVKGKKYSIVVVPFSSEGERERPHAGELLALHFIRRLMGMDGYSVVEPGVVREKLLGLRVIMEQGISRGDLYVVSSSLGTELLLGGKVTKYLDSNVTGGPPKVDFSALLMEGAGRKIIAISESYNQGNDGVFFFDAGMMHTAFEMASKMVNSLLTETESSRVAPGNENTGKIDLLDLFRGEQKR